MKSQQLAQVLRLPGMNGSTVELNGPVGFNPSFVRLGDVVAAILPYFFVFAGIGLLLMLIEGGFSLLTGGTDPKRLESGKQRITYAIVGFLIVFLAYWAVQLIAIMFGLTEFQSMFGGGGGAAAPVNTGSIQVTQ